MINKRDNIREDRRQTSIMLDRSRHDLLGWLKPDAIEPCGLYYTEALKLAQIAREEEERRLAVGDTRPVAPLGQMMQEWVDNILIVSASRKGWRGDAITSILRGGDDGDPEKELTKSMKVPLGHE